MDEAVEPAGQKGTDILKVEYIKINHLKDMHTRSSVMLHEIYKEMQSRDILLTITTIYNQSLDLESILDIARRQLGKNELVNISVSGDPTKVIDEILQEAMVVMRRVLTSSFYTDGIVQKDGLGSMEYLFRDLDKKIVWFNENHKNPSGRASSPIKVIRSISSQIPIPPVSSPVKKKSDTKSPPAGRKPKISKDDLSPKGKRTLRMIEIAEEQLKRTKRALAKAKRAINKLKKTRWQDKFFIVSFCLARQSMRRSVRHICYYINVLLFLDRIDRFQVSVFRFQISRF